VSLVTLVQRGFMLALSAILFTLDTEPPPDPREKNHIFLDECYLYVYPDWSKCCYAGFFFYYEPQCP